MRRWRFQIALTLVMWGYRLLPKPAEADPPVVSFPNPSEVGEYALDQLVVDRVEVSFVRERT